MFFLIFGGFRENVGDLLESFLPGFTRKVGIAVPGLRFPGESF
jgi:hypothetical protein